MSKYKILITQADFLTPTEFIERYSKKGVEAVAEDVEFEGTDEVHTSGYTIRELKSSDFNSLSDEIKTIFFEEGLRGECFGVVLKEETSFSKEIFTETDFDWWS